MTKITVITNCENSPKMQFLRDFNIAYGNGDAQFLIECVADEIQWHMIGDKTVNGKEEYAKVVHEMKDSPVTEYVIEHIITHGKEGAVSGVVKMTDGNQYAFSDIYEFTNHKGSKLKTISSYVIKL